MLLTWLKERYNAEIIAFCADVGQEEELRGLKQKAKRTGASKMYIDNLQDEFARDFIYPIMQAGAIYEDQYFLGTSIARPLIAKRMVEIVRKEKAHAIAHGATGKGNDQVRFELTAAALAPHPAPPSRRCVPDRILGVNLPLYMQEEAREVLVEGIDVARRVGESHAEGEMAEFLESL